MDNLGEDRSEIAFFDVETTVPSRPGQGFAILEFGAILVCPRKLEELRSYSTLVRPINPSLISSLSVRCNGITQEAVASAPTFSEIADTVYDVLHGRIWAGHNILRFDCPRIREAFTEIGKSPPEPKGTIDSLALLTQRFGRRAGDMKMASLANYFGLGKQIHRSLDDVRMNLEVVKYCATVLFLESSLPETFPEKSWVSPNATTRSRRNGQSPPEGTSLNLNTPSSSSKSENIADSGSEGKHQILSLVTSSTPQDPFDMATLDNEVNTVSLQPDVCTEERPLPESHEMPSTASDPEGCKDSGRFLDPNNISIPSVTASLVPLFHGGQKMILLHENIALQLFCPQLKVRFGINSKFVDHAGRPRLNFVVDAPPSLCRVLDACDGVAQKLFVDSGSNSHWRNVVIRKDGFAHNPTVRLHIPIVVIENNSQYATEMYQKGPSGCMQKLSFSKVDVSELNAFFSTGDFVDACLSLAPYDYQLSAGIRLVAKKLIFHNK
uniref:Uncharacterized protein MANES_06G090000 n=1 Tax=Rhizophora mucronata TaxID=61149 RepID=A0A2P2JIX0_RHIMU